MLNKQQDTIKIKVLFVIADSRLGNKIADIYKKDNLPVSFIIHGNGSANSETLDFLGLEDTRKVIFISFLTNSKIQHVYEILQDKLDFNVPGTGIAFTLPISSISSVISQLCITAESKMKIESEGFHMTQNNTYELILTIVSSGYFNQVMDVAKAAGATGGTLIHARGLGTEEAVRFLGITIQPEKDIVLIVAPRDKKQSIMDNITHEVGLATAGKGICFSIPVETAIGLS